MARGSKRRETQGERALADVDAVFSALAHASRRQILLVLHYRGGAMAAGDIADRFSCSWPTTTRHLGVLREAGLVDMTQAGRGRVYRLNTERLSGVAIGWLDNFSAA